MTTVDTLVLGAGLAGLSAGYHLGRRATVVEAALHPGGTASSICRNGFQLDRAVHVLSAREPRTLPWIGNELGVDLQERRRNAAVWFEGRIVPYPLQFNLAYLPARSRLRYCTSAMACWSADRVRSSATSLHEFERSNQGSALLQDFLTPYNLKVWGVTPDQMGKNWGNGYLPRYSLGRLLRGAISEDARPIGHNAIYFYPRDGGIYRIAQAIASRLHDLRLGMRLVSLDYKRRVARFEDGTEISYSSVISTLPLVQLLGAIRPENSLLNGAKFGLRCNPLTIAHVLVPRSKVGGNLHWLYVPDAEIPFYRVSFPHNICEANCPDGWSALTVEIGGEIADRNPAAAEILRGFARSGFCDIENQVWN